MRDKNCKLFTLTYADFYDKIKTYVNVNFND
jgi:hypothetical protein